MTPSTGRSEHRMLKSEFEMTEYELKDVETEIGGAHEVKETEDEVDEDEYGDEELVAIPGRYVESRKKNENSSSHLEQILAKEAKLPPWWKIGGVGGVFLAVIGLSILRTTSECGSTAYWLWTVSNVPVVVGVVLYVRRSLVRKHHMKMEAGFRYLKGDVKWTPKATIFYPIVCGGAGLMAGMFGIGGGIIKNPLMLEMSVLPEVAVATSATMIFFTTGAATITYLTFGLLSADYATLFFLVGFLATIGGQGVMRKLLDKFQRKSMILFVIAGVLALSTVLMTVASVQAAVAAGERPSLCSAGE
mmetsp:Transcript_7819/g.14469  ORF Transcript_7819/g.14469 Transcript_7819/m.14469 type:complete len:304 (-) Transcript_7819:119-1030(-)